MPRANRYILPGHIYHVTHRCHDRQFLLKFAKDRNAYRRRLLAAMRRHSVAILNYDLTSNHVHLILWAQTPEAIAQFMHDAAGEFAREFNRRKQRSGAFWEGRYQLTMVEGTIYLERCLVYVDLNMVRCGVVPHPRHWEWTGYQEIMGFKKRNRLVDIPKLLELLGGAGLEQFRRHYEALIAERIAKDEMAREAQWTETLAVGGEEFVSRMQHRIKNRRETVVEPDGNGGWLLREEIQYSAFFRPQK